MDGSIKNPEHRRALREALVGGALSPADASRAIRALHGLSQADFAQAAGLSIKVIKDLESGRGNPRLSSLRKLADLAGLKVAFISPPFEVELFDPAARSAAKGRRRAADHEAIASGRQSERERDAHNAMHIGEAHVDWPSLD